MLAKTSPEGNRAPSMCVCVCGHTAPNAWPECGPRACVHPASARAPEKTRSSSCGTLTGKDCVGMPEATKPHRPCKADTSRAQPLGIEQQEQLGSMPGPGGQHATTESRVPRRIAHRQGPRPQQRPRPRLTPRANAPPKVLEEHLHGDDRILRVPLKM